MDEAHVARRCFDLIQELLEFAQNHVRQHQRFERQDMHVSHNLHSMQIPVTGYDTDSGLEPNQGVLNSTQSHINVSNKGIDQSMSEIWASMMDPIALEGFVVGDEPIEGMPYDNSWFGGDMMQ